VVVGAKACGCDGEPAIAEGLTSGSCTAGADTASAAGNMVAGCKAAAEGATIAGTADVTPNDEGGVGTGGTADGATDAEAPTVGKVLVAGAAFVVGISEDAVAASAAACKGAGCALAAGLGASPLLVVGLVVAGAASADAGADLRIAGGCVGSALMVTSWVLTTGCGLTGAILACGGGGGDMGRLAVGAVGVGGVGKVMAAGPADTLDVKGVLLGVPEKHCRLSTAANTDKDRASALSS